MSSTLVVGVDVCNTIADVNEQIEKLLGPRPDPEDYGHPGVTESFFRQHPEVFEDARPFDRAARELRLLAEVATVYYITARPIWAKEITRRWLVRHGFPLAEVVCTTNKAEIVRQLGVQIMIEDAPHEIMALRRYTKTLVWRKRQPYNERMPVPPVGW